MKRLSKKKIKKFFKWYNIIIEIMCEAYNLRGVKVGEDDWVVGELQPELAIINHLFIAPPYNNEIDIIKLGKESKSALMELIRVDSKFLYSKKYRKKFLKKLKKNQPKSPPSGMITSSVSSSGGLSSGLPPSDGPPDPN